MGVRFPTQSERPDFGAMQQTNDPLTQSNPLQDAAGASALEATSQAAEENAVGETQEPQAVNQQAPAERAAADAGAQTPGSTLDIIA